MDLDMEEYLPAKKVRKMRDSPHHDWYISMGQYMQYPDHTNAVGNTPPEFLFTFKQVKSMIERAVEKMKEQLEQEYQRELQNRLEQQHEEFKQILETHLSQKLKESTFNYYS